MTTPHRRFKDAIYEQFARIGKAVSAPKRLELLELLCQGPRTVEALAGQALPRNREIVAYFRGPYCVMAVEAVELLRKKGFKAQRMEQGVVAWRARGWRVDTEGARS